MLEESHHLEFPEHALRAHEALKDVGELLERDPLVVPRVGDRPHHAEGPVTDGSVGLVFTVGISCNFRHSCE